MNTVKDLAEQVRTAEAALKLVAQEQTALKSVTFTCTFSPFDRVHLEVPPLDNTDGKLEIQVDVPLNHKGVFKVNRNVLPVPFVEKYLKIIPGQQTFRVSISISNDETHTVFGGDCVPPKDTSSREIKVFFELDATPSVWVVKFTTNEKTGILETFSFDHNWEDHKSLQKEIENNITNHIRSSLRHAYGKSLI